MTDKWVILTRENCVWCDRVKELLKSLSIDYTALDVTPVHSPLRGFLTASGLTTVPQVFRNGQLIGGYRDTERHLLNPGVEGICVG